MGPRRNERRRRWGSRLSRLSVRVHRYPAVVVRVAEVPAVVAWRPSDVVRTGPPQTPRLLGCGPQRGGGPAASPDHRHAVAEHSLDRLRETACCRHRSGEASKAGGNFLLAATRDDLPEGHQQAC
jgi:hypothetical protein